VRNVRCSAFSTLLLGLIFLFAPQGLHAQAQAQIENAGARQGTPLAESPQAQQTVVDEDAAYRNSPVVKKLGAMMGMSTERAATVFNVFNFLVLAVLVGFFLLKTLPKTFRDRTSRIQRHLVDARTATEEASARMNSIEDRLAGLDGQIEAMRTQSEKDAAVDEARIKAAIEEERVKILASADIEIAAATTQAHRQLQQYAAELAIEQAARKLVISAETDRLLVQGFVRRLAGSGAKGGDN